MNESVARCFRVVGGVQRVGYRYWTQSNAQRLGIRGSVRNLADGSVEVVAGGSMEDLDELERMLRIGPPSATVTSVTSAPCEMPADNGFAIGPSR